MKFAGILLAFAVGSFLAGCSNQLYYKGQPLLTGEEADVISAEISQTQFSDMPVPSGFELQNKNFESYAGQVGSFRSGRLIYHGTETPSNVKEYLETRMPEHGWKIENASSTQGNLKITFVKGDTRSNYSITRETETATGEAKPATFFTKLQIDIQTGNNNTK